MSGPLVIKYSTDATQVDSALSDIDKAHGELSTKLTSTGSAVKNSLAPAASAFGLLKGQLGGLADGFGPIGEGAEKAGEGLDHLKEKWSEMENVGQKAGAIMLGAGAAVTGVGAVLTELGHGQETANLQLEQTFKNLGTDLDDYKGKLKSVQSANEGHAESIQETDESLSKLATALNSPKQAFADEAHVVDLAKSQHESLTAATNQYIAIIGGKGTKVLTQYGIAQVNTTKLENDNEQAVTKADAAKKAQADAISKLNELQEIDHTKKTLSIQDNYTLQKAQQKVADTTTALRGANTMVNVSEDDLTKAYSKGGSTLDQLNAKTADMAKTMDSSLGAKIEATKVRLTDLAGKIGNEVGPAMVKAGPLIMGVGAILESNLIPTLITTGAQFVGTGIMAVTTFGSMAAGAIADGATMVASVTATAAVWIAENVAMAAAATAAFIAENAASLGIIAGVAAIVAGIIYLATHWKEVWSDVKQWVGDAWHAVDPIFTAIGSAVKDTLTVPLDAFKAAWHLVWTGVTMEVQAAWAIVKPILDAIKDVLSTVTKGIGGLVSGVGSVVSHIPGLAEGGVVTAPTLAWVGETQSEAVIPLDQLASMGGGGGGAPGGPTSLTMVMDNQVVGQIVYNYLQQTGRQNSTLALP